MSQKGSILVVDDTEGIRTALCRDLRRLGYSCMMAADGGEGLEKLRAGDVDVALIDLRMPGMDGLGLLQAMSEADLDTVPVILSGFGQIPQAMEAAKHGAFEFIEKPAHTEMICKTIERAMKHRLALRRARVMANLAGQWRVAFDEAPDMIVLLGADHHILQVNRAMVERIGRPKEDLVGEPSHEALCRSDHLPEQCPFLHDLRGGHRGPAEFAQKAWGGYFEISSASLGEGAGGTRGSMHIVRDITDRKLAEDQLRNARAEAELLIGSISSVLICLDEDRIIRQWNATAEQTFGIAATDASGGTLAESPIPWDHGSIDAGLTQCMAEGVPVRVDDLRFTRPDGKSGFLAVTINPLRGADEHNLGVLILGIDITERKFLECQLVQARKLEGIGQLAAGIAHEINTPMQYVGDNIRFLKDSFSDLVELLEKYGSFLSEAEKGRVTPQRLAEMAAAAGDADTEYLAEEIPRAIEQSLEGVGRVTEIVRAMRDFSHPGVEEKAAIDINEAIASTITVSRNEWKYVAEMRTDFDAHLPPVLCLPGRLNQVILNLIVNAAHAIGKVVGDGSEGKGIITVSTRRDADWVEIRIRDSGCGIPEDVAEKVFDPFFTTEEVGKGTGQGLAIAHSVVVEKHKGTIAFETQVQKGTTFIIRLPLFQDTGPQKPQGKEATHARETANPLCRR